MRGLEEEQLPRSLRWGGGKATAGRREQSYECGTPERLESLLLVSEGCGRFG